MNRVSDLITSHFEDLSKTHKVIANYVLQNITSTSYMSIKELSEKTGAGEATIIRFCNKIGFEGFPGFKSALREEIEKRGTITERLRESYGAYEGRGQAVVSVIESDIKRIENTLAGINVDDILNICDDIISAKKIFVISSRSANSLGGFLSYYLNMAVGNTTHIYDMGYESDYLSQIENGELVIGLTFYRYCRSTVDLFKYAKKKGAKTIAITDSEVSPLIANADRYLIANTSMPSYIDSFVAPLSLINAILSEIGRQKNVELEKKLSDLDDFYNSNKVF